MKDPYAKFNTHLISAKGYVSYDEKTIYNPKKVRVDIRCTSDDIGETLSLTVNNIQICVKVKDVERVIKEARGETE